MCIHIYIYIHIHMYIILYYITTLYYIILYHVYIHIYIYMYELCNLLPEPTPPIQAATCGTHLNKASGQKRKAAAPPVAPSESERSLGKKPRHLHVGSQQNPVGASNERCIQFPSHSMFWLDTPGKQHQMLSGKSAGKGLLVRCRLVTQPVWSAKRALS